MKRESRFQKNYKRTEQALAKLNQEAARFDFVLSCGDVPFHILEEICDLFKKPIFAVKGNHDPVKPLPKCVEDVHHRMVQHRNWLIGW